MRGKQQQQQQQRRSRSRLFLRKKIKNFFLSSSLLVIVRVLLLLSSSSSSPIIFAAAFTSTIPPSSIYKATSSSFSSSSIESSSLDNSKNSNSNCNSNETNSTSNRTIRVLYAGPENRWERWEKDLQKSFSHYNKSNNIQLINGNDIITTNNNDDYGDDDQEHFDIFDYIIYHPKGPIKNENFAPFVGVNDNVKKEEINDHYIRRGTLRAILSINAGVEGIVNNPTIPLAIPICRMVDPSLRTGMVEYVVGHVMRYHLKMDDHWQNNNNSQKRNWSLLPPPLAQDRTIGVLGMGELGTACANTLCSTLNFRVLGWTRTRRNGDDHPKNGKQKDNNNNNDNNQKRKANIVNYFGQHGLQTVLAESDILILLLPNTPETHHIINKETLSKCKTSGVSIINAGRGSLIDDEALLEALGNDDDDGTNNIVSGATLDVFVEEPLPIHHKYWSHPRVLVTPHCAAKTRSETAANVIVENIHRYENGEELLYTVNRDAGY